MNKETIVVSKALMIEETWSFFDNCLDVALRNIKDILKVKSKKYFDMEYLHSESQH